MSQDHAHAEDQALLQRLRAGEDAAFGELFSRHCDAVRRLALGLAADRAEAEDLTAEAFFRVLQAIRRGSGPTDNVRGYLLIVARRVAWEWNGRRRDVPISDEELNHRVGADPDRTNQSTERNLITRAFTSLPERWRSVLWEVEVEGARPAVVAVNFGLSPNATAALARRARQGLRAAYLQAHLAIDRGSTGCRSVLEKLGAYTAGTIKGVERRKVRAHLATCPSCSAMFAELQDVCSGLRAHAAVLAAPVAGVALWQQMGTVASTASSAAGWTVKGLLANAKVQVALAASSAAAVGAFGFIMVAMGTSSTTNAAFDDFDGRPLPDVVITDTRGATVPPKPGQPVKDSTKAATHEPGTPGRAAVQERQPANAAVTGTQNPDVPAVLRTDEPEPVVDQGIAPKMASEPYDETLPVVYERSTFERKWAVYDQYDVVNESTTTTRVNAAEQTTVVTKTTEYTVYRTPTETGDPRALMSSPPPPVDETTPEETKPPAPAETSEEPVSTKPEPSSTTADPKPTMITAS
ncbi:RNA polymerase sigma factor, sigma-70 family [Actinokineospora alba]|uniref:RNA polymerase sigma factor, sigma-70 family n=1 Tax=Actinokineospora alba TaxID=504798 RepID=A0A1H0WAS1_9PSEU|nr:sigma-70 family RNA polymerase sigma factor [Actinokineospora alba]TDP66203.1 RNA polymerase sigma factor (sigma-70 family) [Actinokineospora alba]SDJ42801.1 RNA polymerase sigma factor, sigma-70 family [Actinokineospora alba]SDP87416.1 RNA polymerase sigma factor, sigma-70 family [Actinokineospora alba]